VTVGNKAICKTAGNLPCTLPDITRGLFKTHYNLTGLTEEKRRIQNEELYNPYSSPNTRVLESRKIRWAGHIASTEDTLLVSRPKKKRTLGRRRRRWEDNFKMDLQEGLIWLSVGTADCCKCGNEFSSSKKCWKFPD
jgi:hypothetical protein